jgi:glycosyltransferase involved in cell wall biosynthesis
LASWDKSIRDGDSRFSGYTIEVLCPDNAKRSLDLKAIKVRRRNLLGGALWELVDLGVFAWDGTLVNFANIAPLVHGRCVTYIHDAQVFIFPASYPLRERLTHQPLFKLAGHSAKRVVTVSQFSSQMLQRFNVAPAKRIAVIYNGADHILRSVPDHSVLEAHGLKPHNYVLMFDSTFAYKNTSVIYQAFRRMGSTRPKLAVIARADLRENISIADDLGDDCVTVSGIDDKALRALYENALVFVQPAKTEGFAMTQLEALNSGSPVITSPLGSMPEVLADAVVYADSENPDAWRDEILRFQQEPEHRSRMLSRGQALAAGYTWQRTADALWSEVTGVALRSS